MKPAQYWRMNKEWKNWLGKSGTVMASTVVRVYAPSPSVFTPYSYVLVDFGGEKKEFMGAGQEIFEVGEKVVCVLRKVAVPEKHDLIPYGIKVAKK
jgi:uncharacterized OB-fold protein